MDLQTFIEHIEVKETLKRRESKSKFYVYVIEVHWRNPDKVSIVYRRYREFFDLQCKLLDLCTKLPRSEKHNRTLPFLPGKILFRPSQNLRIAQERRHSLNVYCKELIKLGPEISRSRVVSDFFQTRSTDVKNNETISRKIQTTDQNPNEISSPLVLPNYRSIEDFKPIEKSEIALKKNSIVQLIRKNENGWWLVRNGEQTGFVPGSFLQPVENFVERSTIRSNETFVVNKTYQAAAADEISLDQGTFVTVLEKSFSGWWKIQFNQLVGIFPAIFLTSCRNRTVPETVQNQPAAPQIKFQQVQITEKVNVETSDEESDSEEIPNSTAEIFFVHTDFVDDKNIYPPLKRAERLEIHEKHDSGWWLGRSLDRDSEHFNWFPSAFLTKEFVEKDQDETKSNLNHDESNEVLQPVSVEDFSSSSQMTNNSNESTKRISVRERIRTFEKK